MDSAEFHAAVYAVVRQIPFGRVTSYGHIAKLIGMPRHSRHVGQALKFIDASAGVPWQRVISSSGKISSRGPGTEGAARQRDALVAEGVDVRETRDGEWKVSWAECGWFPERVRIEAEDGDGYGGDDSAANADEDAARPEAGPGNGDDENDG